MLNQVGLLALVGPDFGRGLLCTVLQVLLIDRRGSGVVG